MLLFMLLFLRPWNKKDSTVGSLLLVRSEDSGGGDGLEDADAVYG